MQELVYIAGELTNGGEHGIVERFNYMYKAIKAGVKLMEKGYDVYIPHLFYIVEALYPNLISYNRALDKGLNMLCRCDSIYLTREWQNSEGARAEYFKALDEGLNIMFEKTADASFENTVGWNTVMIRPERKSEND